MNIAELVDSIQSTAFVDYNVKDFIDFDTLDQSGHREIKDVCIGISLGDPSGEILTMPITMYSMHRVDVERKTLRYAQSLALAALYNTYYRLVGTNMIVADPPVFTQIVWENDYVGYSCEILAKLNLSPCSNGN